MMTTSRECGCPGYFVEYPHWSSFREGKTWGASGPLLDDFEAAVLIAGGVEWHVHDYEAGARLRAQLVAEVAS